jgi:hypothetical protein
MVPFHKLKGGVNLPLKHVNWIKDRLVECLEWKTSYFLNWDTAILLQCSSFAFTGVFYQHMIKGVKNENQSHLSASAGTYDEITAAGCVDV